MKIKISTTRMKIDIWQNVICLFVGYLNSMISMCYIIGFNNDKITKDNSYGKIDSFAICCLVFARKDVNSHRLIRLYRGPILLSVFSSYKRSIRYARYECDDNNEGAGGCKVIWHLLCAFTNSRTIFTVARYLS